MDAELPTRQVENFQIVIPFLPPSSNHIFVTNWRTKKRFLHKDAQAFQKRFMTEVVPNYLPLITRFFDDTSIYSVHFAFFFPPDDILNKTFGEKDGAAERYKQIDTDNRVKLISDCLAKAIGINDKRFFRIVLDKLSCSLVGWRPQVQIVVQPLSLALYGV